MAARFDFAVVGLGYVGLPLAVAAAEVGMRVLGVDLDELKVEALNDGRSYIQDVPDELVREMLGAGFVAATRLDGTATADAYSICVPTPLRNGSPDITAVEAAAGAVAAQLQPGDLVVLESTSFPGTTEDVVMPILATGSGLAPGTEFGLAFSPERIDPGNAEWTLRTTPKIVAGIDDWSSERAVALYGKFCERVVPVSGTREAELAKLIENTYRQVNIALVNEMAILSRELGIDVREAIRAAATKPFGFQAFFPGPGVGGHCIPVDPAYLTHKARQVGHRARLVELAQEINNAMPGYVVDRVVETLTQAGASVPGGRVLLLGVSYKAGVGDVRESPAAAVAEGLLALGTRVSYHDPFVAEFAVGGIEIPAESDAVAAAAAADLVLILTPHPSFDLAAICEAAPVVLDTRGAAPRGLATYL